MERECGKATGQWSRRAAGPCHWVCPTPVAELRAGPEGRPPRGAVAAAIDECLGESEVRPPCRHADAFPCANERPARQLEREVSRPFFGAGVPRRRPATVKSSSACGQLMYSPSP